MKSNMKHLLTIAALTLAYPAFADGPGTPGTYDPPVIVPPGAGIPDPTGLYVKGGLGGADVDPGFESEDVFLDMPWFKKGMPSHLVDYETDLADLDLSATVEIGYMLPIGSSGLMVGAALDYTHFGFDQSDGCHVDAGLEQNPQWGRRTHECSASLDGAASVTLALGYDPRGPLSFYGFVGQARGFGSQSWEGDAWAGRDKQREDVFVSNSDGVDFEVNGLTYGGQVDYSLGHDWAAGLEVQVFDFEDVQTDHDWGDTRTDFDVTNVSLTLTRRF